MPRDHSREQPQWLLARHSALTARQLLRAYGLLCLFSLTIAAAFALRGIWTIPVFSVVELGLVAIALLGLLLLSALYVLFYGFYWMFSKRYYYVVALTAIPLAAYGAYAALFCLGRLIRRPACIEPAFR